MGRKRSFSARWRILGCVALVLLIGLGWGWWSFINWMPSRTSWPVQGVLVGEQDGDANFTALRAVGADFAYLEASSGADSRDPTFSRNLAEVRKAGLRFGAIHHYDPCVPADVQAANFVIVVPRAADLLPPAIELEDSGDDCPNRVSAPSVESELTTFINQVEAHAGKPVILKPSSGFEEQYHLANSIDRDLWLSREWLEPDYAGRPWTLWTANAKLRSDASPGALRWVVAQP